MEKATIQILSRRPRIEKADNASIAESPRERERRQQEKIPLLLGLGRTYSVRADHSRPLQRKESRTIGSNTFITLNLRFLVVL